MLMFRALRIGFGAGVGVTLGVFAAAVTVHEFCRWQDRRDAEGLATKLDTLAAKRKEKGDVRA
jgi:hypothetical protein